MPANYDSIHSGGQGASPYGSGDPYYNESTGYITPHNAPSKKGTSKWVKIGIPVAVIIIVKLEISCISEGNVSGASNVLSSRLNCSGFEIPV